VTDTPPEIASRYRELLLQRSGEARLKMGCSMHAAARALVLASVLEREPNASPAARRRALFLRFYGHEFDAATRDRILTALDCVPVPAQPRRVPIDWDDLELALTMHPDEWASYLDVRTGEIRVSQIQPFGGEREDHELTEEEIEAGLGDGTLIAIEPLPSSVEYECMAEFAEAVSDARLRRSLRAALDGRRPFRRFKDALAACPSERDRWYAFHGSRVREAMRQWLTDNDIEPTTAPPPRPGGTD